MSEVGRLKKLLLSGETVRRLSLSRMAALGVVTTTSSNLALERWSFT